MRNVIKLWSQKQTEMWKNKKPGSFNPRIIFTLIATVIAFIKDWIFLQVGRTEYSDNVKSLSHFLLWFSGQLAVWMNWEGREEKVLCCNGDLDFCTQFHFSDFFKLVHLQDKHWVSTKCYEILGLCDSTWRKHLANLNCCWQLYALYNFKWMSVIQIAPYRK